MGNLSKDPRIVKSSGIPQLDAGAISLAKAGRYKPGTCYGKPIADCFQFKITFGSPQPPEGLLPKNDR